MNTTDIFNNFAATLKPKPIGSLCPKPDTGFTVTFDNRDAAIRALCERVFGAVPVYSEDFHGKPYTGPTETKL